MEELIDESHRNRPQNRLMRYNRTRSESRINTGVSLISSKLSVWKFPATDNRIFRKGRWDKPADGDRRCVCFDSPATRSRRGVRSPFGSFLYGITGTDNPRRYWSDLKRKLKAEEAVELYENIVQLKLTAPDGKKRATDVANTGQLLRCQ